MSSAHVGKTHIEDGVMLCSHHRHAIRADQSPVVIRKHDGDLRSVGRSHRVQVAEHQRRQRGPALDAALRRTHDPARTPFRS